MAVRSSGRGTANRKRVVFAFWIILICYLLLVGRLVYLQVKEGPLLLREALSLRERHIPLAAHRGSIFDRSGNPLAISLYSGVVGFDPSVVLMSPASPKDADRMRKALAAGISRAAGILGIPLDQLQKTVNDATAAFNPSHPVRFVPVARGVTAEVASRIRDCVPRLVGFGVQDGSRREYTEGENAAQVVGFMGPEALGVARGAAGLERSCGGYMSGRAGYAVAELDTLRREIPDTARQLVKPVDGLDIHTTLDSTAQQIAMEEARKVEAQYTPRGISVVIADPMTGDVLALASLPTFDPNARKFTQDDISSRGVLNDRCSAMLYEPGSTLKSLTVAAALDQGVISQSSAFYCPGVLKVGNKLIHCAMHGQAGGHGLLDARGILQHSCNVGAAQIGMKMGPDQLFAAERKFGLLDSIEVGLPGEQRGRLSFDGNERIYTQSKAARVAFGHSITTTPLHVAMAYCALVNGGILMRPRLITSVTGPGGRVCRSWKPQQIRRVISQETSAVICDMLRNVVTAGTGKVAAIPGYQVGGKTGTANKYHAGRYIGSFIGFVPASPQVKPRVVILVAVDEPHGAYYGAEVAAPAFQAIARRLMDYWQVPKDDPQELQARAAYENLKKSGELTPAMVAMRKDKD